MFQYIDIFDDALYEPSLYVSTPTDYEDLHHTIRLQILVTLLFGNQVIVPEQWAVSSLPFLRISNEVIKAYTPDIEIKIDSGPPIPDLVDPPIVISFWDRGTPQKDQLALAMYSRLSSGRRLGLTSSLREVKDGETTSQRKNLTTIFRDLAENRNRPAKDDRRITRLIRDELDNSAAAVYIRELSAYLDKYPDAVKWHDPGGYGEALSRQVESVSHVCFNDGALIEQGGLLIKEFQEFFIESRKLDIKPDEISKMWEIARRYSDESYYLITKMGQYCMHRSMSEKISANYDSTFYGSFGDGPRSVFDEKVVNSVRKRYIDSGNFTMKYRDLQFLATEHAVNYDLYDKFNWTEVWSNVAEFSRSPQWRQVLIELRATLNEVEADEIHQNAVWKRAFDRINDRMRSFTFRSSPRYEGFAEILVNVVKDARDTAVAGPASDPRFSFLVPLAMLAALASASIKMTPFEIQLSATRKYRRARQMFSDK